MFWFRTMFGDEQSSKDLLISTSQYQVYSTFGIYLLFHFVASLFLTQIFSPKLWICTAIMLFSFLLTRWLIHKFYALAQVVWLLGLFLTIQAAYIIFQRPEILFLLTILPIQAIVTTGLGGALISEVLLVIAVFSLPQLSFFPGFPGGYTMALIFCFIFSGIIGWGISSNLLAAIEQASFHYYEARKRLEETRQHRAEISHMLKEQSQSNYQLKQMNRMLEQARSRAEEAREDRDRFAMAVSHELRTPLNFIIGFSDLMVNAPDTYADSDQWPPGLFDDIQEIYNSSQHLMDLINDILDMGKIDARRMPIFRERVKPISVLEEIEDLVSAQIASKGLDFVIQCEDSLPYIFVDRTRIRQVLLNVVTNSLRFTKKGQIKIDAHLLSADEIEIVVTDSGPGITTEDLEKIFDEFRQVGQENWSREKSSGLGLSISKRFVELHGGKMRVESVINEGTTIRIILPVMEPMQSIIQSRDDLMEGGSRRVASQHARTQSDVVLCFSLDGNKEKIMSQIFIHQQVIFVESLAQLKEMLSVYYPVAVIIDDVLMNQADLKAYLTHLTYDLPVVSFLFSAINNRTFLLPPGVYRYLVKPVSRENLARTINSLGDSYRNLLVVDDDPSLVRLFTQAIRSSIKQDPQMGRFSFIPAYSGHEALQLLQSQPIDAVLLDLDLPDIHGTEVLAEIKKSELLKHLPVIIISASDITEEIQMISSASMQILVNRPFEMDELTSIVQTVLVKIKPQFEERKKRDQLKTPIA